MLQFTKEVKDNWLANLRSGKYKQGFGMLYTEKEDACCCIEVLKRCTPELQDDNNIYSYLYVTIGTEVTKSIITANDKGEFTGHSRDYSNVIPLIEKLPTID